MRRSPRLRFRTAALLILVPVLALLGSAPLRPQDAAPAANAAPDSAPTPAEMAEIVPLLQKSYFNPPALKEAHSAADWAALFPTLRGVALLPQPSARLPLRTELLNTTAGRGGPAGYWRVTSFSPPKGDWNALAVELAGWQAGGLLGLVLDLRDNAGASADDFAGAARLASLFVPDKTLLFSIQALQTPQQVFQTAALPGHPPFAGPLVVLVGRQTRGAAEALAQALRRQAGAVLVGRSTAGEAALFAEAKLKSGRALRIAAAPALLPDGTPLFAVPLVPDIALYIPDETEAQVLAQIRLGPALRGLVEAPAHRHLNEASLVHEINPELDQAIADQAAKSQPKAEAGPVADIALIRAVDILRGVAAGGTATGP